MTPTLLETVDGRWLDPLKVPLNEINLVFMDPSEAWDVIFDSADGGSSEDDDYEDDEGDDDDDDDDDLLV